MGFFKALKKAAISTVLLPVDVVKDVVTVGGMASDRQEPYTVTRAKKLSQRADELLEALDELDED